MPRHGGHTQRLTRTQRGRRLKLYREKYNTEPPMKNQGVPMVGGSGIDSRVSRRDRSDAQVAE